MIASQYAANNQVIEFAHQLRSYFPDELLALNPHFVFDLTRNTTTRNTAILRELAQNAPRIFALCYYHKKMSRYLLELINYLVEDIADIPRTKFEYIVDDSVYPTLSEWYHLTYTFFGHYSDYLFSIGKADKARIVFSAYLHQYGMGAVYAFNFISRYCITYTDLISKIDSIPELFVTDLYLLLVSNDTFAANYLADRTTVLLLDTIPHINPHIARDYFSLLSARCLGRHNTNKLVEELRAQTHANADEVYQQLMSKYDRGESMALIKARVNYTVNKMYRLTSTIHLVE